MADIKKLAEELTVMIHSKADYDAAVDASQILFGKGTAETVHKMDEKTLLSVFDGVPSFEISKSQLGNLNFASLCVDATTIFPSKGELRRMIQGGGVSLNKQKVDNMDLPITSDMLLNGKYLLVQKGKKNYNLVTVK